MKLITRDTDYAIRALCSIARQEKKVTSVNKLVAELKMPKPFLRKILQTLNKKKLLKSYKGKGGGFVLSRAPKSISVIDIVEAFQGPVVLSEHIFKKTKCRNINSCYLKAKLDGLEKHVISELSSLNIALLKQAVR